jgi:hypothetical protein
MWRRRRYCIYLQFPSLFLQVMGYAVNVNRTEEPAIVGNGVTVLAWCGDDMSAW